jgi:D-beta-D-heptose 7-phosphate kinase/D-beta-D-heptose 1-phosphate adenosyltransferase
MSAFKQISTDKKVLVIGDVMLDEYTFGHVERISPEAPVPILRVEEHQLRLGGAANVAANISSLGIKVSLMGICGDDDTGSLLVKEMQRHSVDSKLLKSDDVNTIVKKRIIANQQQLIRIDQESRIDSQVSKNLYKKFLEIYIDYDLVVISDYGKGSLIDHQKYIKSCNLKNISVLIDPKGGDFDRYKNATLMTPNLREFEEIVGTIKNNDELVDKAISLKNELGLRYLIVTLGPEGVLMVDDQNNVHMMTSEAKQVYDVSGAGDTIIAVLAVLIVNDYEFVSALKIANVAAGLAVGKVGTSVISYRELDNALNTKDNTIQSLHSIDQLMPIIEQAKLENKKIVMTNGCFDILHAGHVTYLKEAAKLGNILIVAINSDISVSKLKGKSRPINPLEMRATVLSSLSAVDYVISFEEDTPEKLYELVLPDILVKGSDYSKEEIAGADIITSNGGMVKLIDLVEGFSTTSIIDRINKHS